MPHLPVGFLISLAENCDILAYNMFFLSKVSLIEYVAKSSKYV